MFVGAEALARLFTSDAATIDYAVGFTRAFAVAMLPFAVFFPLAGALRGAGDTRTPFYARLLGSVVFMLGASYLLAITLGYGIVGVYAGMVLSYACWAVVVAAGFLRGEWIATAESMIDDRAAMEAESED